MGVPLQHPPDLAIRLADEGIPLRAIARATKTPSELVRQELAAAKQDGRLLDLPRDDWPPGFPRDQRALQLSRLVSENREVMLIALQQMFRMTPTEIGLLLLLLQHPTLLKGRITGSMTARTVDVHICSLRKRLQPFGIDIQTLWGYGYQLSNDNRRKVMDLVLNKVTAEAPA